MRTGAARKVIVSSIERLQCHELVRIVHWSVQSNHLHLIIETEDRRCLSRAMQGLLSGVARRLNRLWRRCGTVWRDRYHDAVLRTPRQVRNALAYVLHNARRHGVRLTVPLDSMSSAATFDGWREDVTVRGAGVADARRAARTPETWLLREGWQRHGLVSIHERPGPNPARRLGRRSL